MRKKKENEDKERNEDEEEEGEWGQGKEPLDKIEFKRKTEKFCAAHYGTLVSFSVSPGRNGLEIF